MFPALEDIPSTVEWTRLSTRRELDALSKENCIRIGGITSETCLFASELSSSNSEESGVMERQHRGKVTQVAIRSQGKMGGASLNERSNKREQVFTLNRQREKVPSSELLETPDAAHNLSNHACDSTPMLVDFEG